MANTPRVSVVLPTYNRAGTLLRAIYSVLNQDFKDLELIVIDDGSSDETEQIVGGVSDVRLRYQKRANGGPAAARNSGIALANGEWLCFQDSDDEWLPTKLSKQVQHMHKHPDAVLGVCGYLRYEKEDVAPQYYGASCFLAVDNLHRQALKMFFYATPTWMARKDILLAAGGFDENLECWEDWEFALRLSERGPFALLDEPLVIQHVTAGSVNSALPARSRSLALMLQRHHGKWAEESALLFDILFDVGRGECLGLSCRSGRRWLWRAGRLRPFALRAWACWLAAALGPFALRVVLSLARRLGLGWHRPRVVW